MDLDTLLLPLQFDFMQDALLMAAIVAVPCALLSCFLVLKGWALLGDAISHAVFPGVVIAWMVGAPLALGAFVAGMGCEDSHSPELFIAWFDSKRTGKGSFAGGVVVCDELAGGQFVANVSDPGDHFLS